MTRERQGLLLCLLTAAAWSTTAIFSKLAYQAGVGVATLLVVRNLLGASLFWSIVGWRRVPLPPRPVLVRGLLLGLVGASVQTWCFASALSRIDAGLASMLLYTYPAMVLAGAVLLGRERATTRRLVALGLASLGAALVLSGSLGGSVDALGVLMALGAALTYTVSVLVSQTLLRATNPLVLAGMTTGGAALTFVGVGMGAGALSFAFERWAWLPLVGLAFVPTLIGASCSLAGVERIGPSRASIMFMLEVPLTVLVAALVFGERLSLLQLTGGVVVLAGIGVLQARREVVPRAATLPPGSGVAAIGAGAGHPDG